MNNFISALHDRRPVILSGDALEQWIFGGTNVATPLIELCPDNWLASHIVPSNIGSDSRQTVRIQ